MGSGFAHAFIAGMEALVGTLFFAAYALIALTPGAKFLARMGFGIAVLTSAAVAASENLQTNGTPVLDFCTLFFQFFSLAAPVIFVAERLLRLVPRRRA